MFEFYEKKVAFVGGSKDGQVLPVSTPDKRYLPKCMYYAKPLSLEEDAALKVDEAIKHRGPDEVYELQGQRGDWHYVFSHVIHYDPRRSVYKEVPDGLQG